MARYLLTGFGPFPGCPVNPSGFIAEAVARDLGIAWRVLPVTWDVPARLAAEAAAYDGVVALGVARGRRGVQVERLAYNDRGPEADASGACGGGALVEGAPASIDGCLHLRPEVVAAAQALGLPVD